jgi:hypothetical protein
MRTLLRHIKTGKYFAGPDTWTDSPARAYDFRFVDRALKYVETWKLENVELAFAFDDYENVTGVSLEKAALQYTVE